MEIIVVLIIIAVLAAALIPSFVKFAQNARASTAIAEARVGMTAAQAVVTEILASGYALDPDPSVQILTYGSGKFASYLTGDVTSPGGFSDFTLDGGGLRVNGLKYVTTGFTVVINPTDGAVATPN